MWTESQELLGFGRWFWLIVGGFGSCPTELYIEDARGEGRRARRGWRCGAVE